MWPTLFKIGDFPIGTFGLFVAIGFFAAYWVATHRARKAGLDRDLFANLAIYSLIGGILGAKLLFVAVYFGQAPLTELLFSRSGLVFYGGLIAGIGTGWVLTLRYGWNPAVVADIGAPAVPLGQFFGRIGCLFNGCCYGKVCRHAFGIRFPRIMEGDRVVGSEAFQRHLEKGLVGWEDLHSLPVWPTQLMCSLGCLFIFLFLHFYWSKRKSFEGQLALLYLLLYSGLRFCVEIFRDDPRTPWGEAGLSTSQVISLLLAAAACALWVPLKKRSQARPSLYGGEA